MRAIFRRPRPNPISAPGLLAFAIVLALAGPARADAVTDWNANFGAAAPAYGGPPQQAYLGALVHIAIHDALNSIDRRYDTYSMVGPASPNASADAAVAAAARDVLVAKLGCLPTPAPARVAACGTVASSYAAALGAIANGGAKDAGVAAGQAAAAAILSMRTGDGSDTPNLPYLLAVAPGVYQPTPPNYPTPANAGVALMQPFVLRRGDQFRADPGELFDLTSEAYTDDYNLVKSIGSFAARVNAPDSPETDIARFWPAGGANWSLAARTIVSGRNLDRWQHARLFALMLVAEADAMIQVFETKYTYNFWRPVTAIRWLDDGNPATAPDPTWLPFFSFIGPWSTPPYPDYTCGLPTAAGANTEVLRRYFGTDRVPYALTVTAAALVATPGDPPLLPAKSLHRSFATLSQAADEAARSRVYAGIHFYEGCVQGVRHGEKVGRFVFQHALRPAKPPAR